METDTFLNDFQAKYGKGFTDIEKLSENRVLIKIRKESILEISEFLYKEMGFRFIIASAMDMDEGFEIIYHYSLDKTGLIVNISTIVPGDKPEIESIANMSDGAEWIEREMYELLGIQFPGHPNLSKLISDGNWEENEFPYRKN